MMKIRFIAVVALWLLTQILYAQNTITIGKTMYQNQAFTTKDKQIFDADKEGSRVWSQSKAIRYCEKLKLDGYRDWRVASKKEFQAIMTRKPSSKGLFVKSIFAMPATGGKYDNVWMWTRFAKAPNLGEYINFKKAKSGWASDKYKGYVVCTRDAKQKPHPKQELTHSRDWVRAWGTCSGYTALKKDGTLWQFGKVGGCDWGQIIPMDPSTGKMSKPKYIYHLKPTKIGSGFKGAKFTNGGYRLYAINRDGTLWGWGEGLGVKPLLLSKSRDWSVFGIRYEGNGCCGFDVGLKKDGTLWRFPESAFSLGRYKTPLVLKKISRFSDWKKIVLGCCTLYGVRKDGSLWKSDDIDYKGVFKKYKVKKISHDGDTELYPYLKSNMQKVPTGTIYAPQYAGEAEVNKDGTLWLLPEEKY